MSMLETTKTLIEYHVDMTHLVWESIGHITEEQFLADDAYSRGSIRNLMVHLTSTDRRWLTGLKNEPDVGHLRFEDYPTRDAARRAYDNVAKDWMDYAYSIGAEELNQNAQDMPWPRLAVVLHCINHGTDHRATVLQRLAEFGAPTFDQDFILWLMRK